MLLSYSNLFPKELELFLSAHPQLLWIHYLASNEYNKVCVCVCGVYRIAGIFRML